MAMFFLRKNRRSDEVSVPDLRYAAIPPSKALKKELRIAGKEQQFVVYMQPRVNLNKWVIQGVEILLRWQHPRYGLIQPEHFIPVLEEAGLIQEVGLWVLHKVCTVNKQWQDSGLTPLQIAVNISRTELQQNNFLDSVNIILDKTGLAPEFLEFELSDCCLFDSINENIELFRQIRSKGIKLAFKYSLTGLPTTINLSELPVDIINIKKELTQQITNNRENRQIMSTILGFAHEHQLEVVAEGVETVEQLIFLNAMHCKMAQGFLFNHPVTIDNFEALYRSNTKYDHLIEKACRRRRTK